MSWRSRIDFEAISGWNKVLDTPLSPSGQIRRTSLKERLYKSVRNVCGHRLSDFRMGWNCRKKWHQLPAPSYTQRLALRLVSLARRCVWSDLAQKKGVSSALFHPEIASESNYLQSHLVLNSQATASDASKSHLVLAQSVLTLVVYKLYACIFFSH